MLMKNYSALLLIFFCAILVCSCKKNNSTPDKNFLFEAYINGNLWKADSAKAIINGPPNSYEDNFTIVASDKNANAFFLWKTSPVASSVDFVVESVSLLSFQAYRDFTIGNKIKLTWSTGKESETERFIVERSFDARNVVSAGEVLAAGNSNERKDYEWNEKPPLNEAFGLVYYRLKILDQDGKYAYSSILAIRGSTPALYIFNNDYSYGFHGSISITANDKEKRIISGTFYFSCIDDATGSTIKIENGKFENLPY